MFTHKDIENRSIFIINGVEHQALKVSVGRLLLEDTQTGKVITKFPFPKILCLIVVGHTTLTTPLIEHCNKNGIPIVVMKPNFRPVFYFGNMAEANYLLRKKQFENTKGDLNAAKSLIKNKLENQIQLLEKTLERKPDFLKSLSVLNESISQIDAVENFRELMGLEGTSAKHYFKAYFGFADWNQRVPRVKIDPLNATLDIGYTMLFNYMECMTRLFGFDPYMGVYHQLWFRRKSLVCDLIEPFRCIIDHQVRKSLKNETFKPDDFEVLKNSYYLKHEYKKHYTKTFFEAIVEHKTPIYKYVQQYYRCFMGRKSANQYPRFIYE